MEKDRKFRALAIAAICIAVVGVSVAYAALTASLTITGTATVDTSASWNIHWASGATATATPVGSSSVVANPAVNAAGTELTWAVKFTAPGDSVTISANMVNDGTLNAALADTSADIKANGNAELTKHFTYSMKVNSKTLADQKGKILASKASVPVEIVVTLNSSITTEEWNAINALENKTVTFTANLDFVQAANDAKDTL